MSRFILVLLAFAFGVGLWTGRATKPATVTDPHWAVAGELSRPRAYATALALETGEILVVGGLDARDPRVTLSTAELFDPTTGRVTVLPQQLLGRLHQSMTEAPGGRVVVTGGTEWVGDHWNSVDDVDLYLVWSRTWLRAAPMRQPRSDHGATLLLDGRVLVTGGNYNTRIVRPTEIYDPATNRWTAAEPLPRGRTQFSVATLPDGTVLVAGGFQEDGAMTTTTLIYEPWADRWVEGPEAREVRLNHSMVQLASGDLLFFGGEAMGGESAELYSWRDRRFLYAGILGDPRLIAQGAVLPDGRVVAVGGLLVDRDRRRFDPTVGAEVWDPQKRVWRDISDAPTKRAYAQLIVTDRGAYRISGVGENEASFATIEALVLD